MSSIHYNFKVDNPTLNNEVIQMRSEHLQPPIHWGITSYYLNPVKTETKFKNTKIKISNLRK